MRPSPLLALVAWLLRRHPVEYFEALGPDILRTLEIREAEARNAGTWRWTRFAIREASGALLSLIIEGSRRLRSLPSTVGRELHQAAAAVARS